ncbi:EF-hand domain pair family protein [Leishmania donovani]|uniref:EF-hand domain pair family protein n=1 Tax=Leishmania donovani TaxID=5661 RepID=A0A504XFP1_LEIDO|nr:EF-hand domain pair family protein [Leishmania donovani]
MANLCLGEDFSEELTCAVCLDSWKDPVELMPCGHIFCKACATGLKECPVCRDPIRSTKAPNRTLVNMALQIRVKPPPAPASSSSAAYDYRAPVPSACANYGDYTAPPNLEDFWTSGAPAPPATAPGRPRVIEPTGPRPWTLYGLDQSEYDQIVSLFVFFDDNESGNLEPNEVTRLARWLNFANTPQDVKRIFDDMDVDRSGKLSLGEFLTWLRYNKPNPQALYGLTQSQYNTIMMQFHTYDKNQDGCLEMNEFSRLVQNLGDVRDAVTAQRLFQMIDQDRDGVISLHEFLRFRSGKY